MCDKADLEQPVNLISERTTSPISKINNQHHQQQKEFVEAGRRQLEHFLTRNLLGSATPLHGLTHSKLTSSMDPLHLHNQILSHFGSNGISNNIENGGSSKRPSSSRKRRSEEGGRESPPSNRSPLKESCSTSEPRHPLFSHGICRWTGCEMIFESFEDFLSHLNSEHVISDRSTAQTRVQVQIVSQLEIQIRKEKDRLEAMMEHFNKLKEEEDVRNRLRFNLKKETPLLGLNGRREDEDIENEMSEDKESVVKDTPPLPTLTRMKSNHSNLLNNNQMIKGAFKVDGQFGRRRGSYHNKENTEGSPRAQSPLSPCGKSKQNSSGGSKSLTSPEKGTLDPENEIIRNREFYRTQDVRPPCTYAALIRQAINESIGRQLTLNEIYTWFQNTFAYFRRNAATWKNAVRHNLSLHKCFMRVENVKGAVWTVDETEYHRRRPQRGVPGGPPSSLKSPSSPSQDSSSYNGGSDIMSLSQQHQQAALVAEHQAYLQGLGASLGVGRNGALRRDEYYYAPFPYGFGLKTEISEEQEEETQQQTIDDQDETKSNHSPTRSDLETNDNQRESLESNDSNNPEDLSSWN